MPTYTYDCGSCRRRYELQSSWAERPKTVFCIDCNVEAEPVITGGSAVLIKNQPYQFDKSKAAYTPGANRGRTEQQQHEHYQRTFNKQRALIKEQKRSLNKKSDDGWQYLGGMPGEMADTICEMEGDKETLYRDPVTFLKKTDLYMGD